VLKLINDIRKFGDSRRQMALDIEYADKEEYEDDYKVMQQYLDSCSSSSSYSSSMIKILYGYKINTALSWLRFNTLDIFAGAGINSNQLTLMNKRRHI